MKRRCPRNSSSTSLGSSTVWPETRSVGFHRATHRFQRNCGEWAYGRCSAGRASRDAGRVRSRPSREISTTKGFTSTEGSCSPSGSRRTVAYPGWTVCTSRSQAWAVSVDRPLTRVRWWICTWVSGRAGQAKRDTMRTAWPWGAAGTPSAGLTEWTHPARERAARQARARMKGHFKPVFRRRTSRSKRLNEAPYPEQAPGPPPPSKEPP